MLLNNKTYLGMNKTTYDCTCMLEITRNNACEKKK